LRTAKQRPDRRVRSKIDTERLRSLIDRLSPADRTRLLSIAGVLDQIVQLANEQDEKRDETSGK
jgi:nitrogen-specific signal transduction histidine kinase